MRAPSSKVLGISIVLVALAAGFALMGRDDDAPAPKVRTAASRAEVERAVREGEVLAGPADTAFRLRHPADWVPVERGRLPKTDPAPLAGLRRTNNAALLTVSVGPAIEGDLGRLARELPAQLERSGGDFELITARQVRVAAGPALYASFTRRPSGQIQTVLLVPDGDRSFRVDAAVRPEAQDAAAQVGVMLRSFDISGR